MRRFQLFHLSRATKPSGKKTTCAVVEHSGIEPLTFSFANEKPGLLHNR